MEKQLYKINPTTLKGVLRRQVMNVPDLAEKAKLRQETVRNILRGYRTLKGQRCEHLVSTYTLRAVATALGVDEPEWLLQPWERVQSLLEVKAALSQQFPEKDVLGGSLFDPVEALKRAREELDWLNYSSLIELVPPIRIRTLKEQIKQLCIFIEMECTRRVAAASPGSSEFLYADSSIVDAGIIAYAHDLAWKGLLYAAGRAAKQYGGRFHRTLFVNPRPVSPTEYEALCQIVVEHTVHSHSVALVDTNALATDLRPKRNLGAMGCKYLVAATDQLQWDLEYSDRPQRLAMAIEQHKAFTVNALCRWPVGADAKQIREMLKDFFPIIESATSAPYHLIGGEYEFDCR